MTSGGIYVATFYHTIEADRFNVRQSTSVVAIVKGHQLGGVYYPL